MQAFESIVDVLSDDFKENYEGMLELVEELNSKHEEAQFQGEKRHTDRFAKNGKLLARERIELLLDDDSPFLEIGALIGYGQEV